MKYLRYLKAWCGYIRITAAFLTKLVRFTFRWSWWVIRSSTPTGWFILAPFKFRYYLAKIRYHYLVARQTLGLARYLVLDLRVLGLCLKQCLLDPGKSSLMLDFYQAYLLRDRGVLDQLEQVGKETGCFDDRLESSEQFLSVHASDHAQPEHPVKDSSKED